LSLSVSSVKPVFASEKVWETFARGCLFFWKKERQPEQLL
jgi:hypothetical protein